MINFGSFRVLLVLVPTSAKILDLGKKDVPFPFTILWPAFVSYGDQLVFSLLALFYSSRRNVSDQKKSTLSELTLFSPNTTLIILLPLRYIVIYRIFHQIHFNAELAPTLPTVASVPQSIRTLHLYRRLSGLNWPKQYDTHTCQGQVPGTASRPSTTLALTRLDFDIPHLEKLGRSGAPETATKDQSQTHFNITNSFPRL